MSPLRGDEAGLYVHIPFCSSICPYCDFAVTTGRDSKKARFVETLLREIDSTQSSASFDTVYFGGGTPSCLDPIDLERIFAAISSRFSIVQTAMATEPSRPAERAISS